MRDILFLREQLLRLNRQLISSKQLQLAIFKKLNHTELMALIAVIFQKSTDSILIQNLVEAFLEDPSAVEKMRHLSYFYAQEKDTFADYCFQIIELTDIAEFNVVKGKKLATRESAALQVISMTDNIPLLKSLFINIVKSKLKDEMKNNIQLFLTSMSIECDILLKNILKRHFETVIKCLDLESNKDFIIQLIEKIKPASERSSFKSNLSKIALKSFFYDKPLELASEIQNSSSTVKVTKKTIYLSDRVKTLSPLSDNQERTVLGLLKWMNKAEAMPTTQMTMDISPGL